MDNQKYLDDIRDIKEMMDRSSKFISLSGLSGVAAGICALVGLYFAYDLVYEGQNYLQYRVAYITKNDIIQLMAIALATVTGAVGLGIYFTQRRAKERGEKLWTKQTRKMIGSMLFPLLAGGAFSIALLSHGLVGLIAPITMIFYGFALMQASHFTFKEIGSLGRVQVLFGILGTIFIGYGLILWGMGFGLLHIIYGVYMHIKNK